MANLVQNDGRPCPKRTQRFNLQARNHYYLHTSFRFIFGLNGHTLWAGGQQRFVVSSSCGVNTDDVLNEDPCFFTSFEEMKPTTKFFEFHSSKRMFFFNQYIHRSGNTESGK
jgi:hypothetical protein